MVRLVTNRMEQARKAGGSGIGFTTAVIIAIISCVALLAWSASCSGPDNPPITSQSR
jgi:hypothetical protein